MKIKRFGQGLQDGVHFICRFLGKIASFILFPMMLITVCDVFTRKTSIGSIVGAVELSEFMLVIVVFFCIAYTEMMDGHVKVDFVMIHFGKRTQALVEMAIQLAGFILFGLITWATVVYAEKMRVIGEVSQDLWLPKYPFIYLVALGCALFSLALLMKSLAALARLVKP
jgi:TRAP-type mannitol/chloroaromatic compound transport system permease small subunit